MIKVPLLRHQRYISPPPLTLPLQNQRQNVPEKIVDFDTFDGHAMVNYILNQTCRKSYLDLYKSRFDHSETILGPLKKLPFLRQDPLSLHSTLQEQYQARAASLWPLATVTGAETLYIYK